MISFILNGKEANVTTSPRRRLLNVLREDLGLTGTKEGCATGHCGACAVIVDGEVVKSCLTQVGKVAGKTVITIEGIGSFENLHPLQKSFIHNLALQCGFCTPGIIVTAKALLDKNANPTPAEIKDALEGNLCRCTGYGKIVEAVTEAAEILRGAPLPHPAMGQGIGSSTLRVGDVEKVIGTALYAADLSAPGMVHAAVLRSPHHHARIKSIETSKALAFPGVECVLTARDIPGVNRVQTIVPDQPILAEGKVRQIGDPVALVAAVTPETARRALSLIEVDYELIEPVLDPLAALEETSPKVHESGNLLTERRVIKGDVELGFAQADEMVENVYLTPLNEHAYLEPEAGLAQVDEEGHVTLRVATHSPHRDRALIAAVLGLPVDRVRVICTVSGGDFGGKAFTSCIPIYSSLALLAYKLKKPVKFVFSRSESFEATSKRHPFQIKCRTGASRQGKLTSIQMEIVANAGAYSSSSLYVLLKAVGHATGPYQVPNVHIVGKSVYTNFPFAGSFRGFGLPQVTFAVESQMDILARRLDIDPLEFRLRNLLEPGAETATRQVLGPSVGIRQTLEAVRSHYIEARNVLRQQKNEGDVRKGVGVASYWGSIGIEEMNDYAEAHVELQEDGRLHVFTGATDIGQGAHTALTQIAAEVMGVPAEAVVIEATDTATSPDCWSGSGSKQTITSGNAVMQATEELKRTVIATAARTVEERVEDVYLADGFLRSRANPDLRVPLTEIVARCREVGMPLRAEKRLEFNLMPLDPLDGNGALAYAYTFATHVAEVEVNIRTGQVKVSRIVAAHDVGRAIHPRGCEVQVEGGLLLGLGFALKEEFIPGKTRGFGQYTIPTMKDAPDMVPILVEVAEPVGPFGAKGFGEASQSPTAPAIVNAIYDATEVRVFQLPATPVRLTKAFEEASPAGSSTRGK